jgi:hypothetical protein
MKFWRWYLFGEDPSRPRPTKIPIFLIESPAEEFFFILGWGIIGYFLDHWLAG